MHGFTPLVERIGAESAFSIMDQIYELLIHKIHDYEGTVNEMTGDGVMALFGAPIAIEDAPQRAIRSAYAIHRALTKFNEQKQSTGDLRYHFEFLAKADARLKNELVDLLLQSKDHPEIDETLKMLIFVRKELYGLHSDYSRP
jgi:hypothetical protein